MKKTERESPRLTASALTLVELLVVIAIVGILASLLLPAVSGGKAKAQSLRCVGNHRQLAGVWMLYAGDNEDRLPPNLDSIDNLGVPTNWVAGNLHFPSDATNEALLIEPSRSALADYVQSSSIFKCPADRSVLVRSVSMNCRMGPTRLLGPPSWVGGLGTNYVTFYRLGEIANPSGVFVFIDERSDTINDGSFAVDMSNTGTPEGTGTPKPYYLIDYPSSAHAGAGAVAFADGHVEIHRWLEAATKPPFGQAQPRRYTSDHDRDTQWLQEHSTYRH